jgi:hypothetical protein
LLPLDLPRTISTNESHISAIRRSVGPGGRSVGGFAEFRLRTGWPSFVDFKSIPYKDVQVLEWDRRVDRVVRAYDALRRGQPGGIEALCAEARLTYVATFAEQELPSEKFQLVYKDEHYRVYRVVRTEE